MKCAGRAGIFPWVAAGLSFLSGFGCGGAGPAPSLGASPGARHASPAPPTPPAPPVCALASGLAPLPMPALELEGLAAREPSRKNLRAWVDTLADPALRGRAAGSEENRRVADLVARALASFGLSASPGGDHCVSFERSGVRDQNVLGRLARGDLGRAAPEVLIGAHYDAQGASGGEVWPGGDDNASGVAALLEVARITALRGSPFDLGFAAFGAEEQGALGSKAYVEAEAPRLSRLALMINLDMVGRPLLDGSPLRIVVPRADEALAFVVGERNGAATRALLDRAALREDRPIVGIPESMMTRLGYFSDSVPFGPHAPTIFLSDGALADYHQPTDTAAAVDINQIERAARLVLAILDELEKERGAPRE